MSYMECLRRQLLASLAVSSMISVSTIANAAIVPGATEATFGVDQNGGAEYTIPIRATAGIGEMTPRLAVTYGGSSQRGILGVGFAIAGLSRIEACAQTIAQDTAAGPITLSSLDRYCLDGARLRVVTGNYGESESVYRTEVDQLARITAKNSVDGRPGWFKVEMRDGRIYEYGNTTNNPSNSAFKAGPWQNASTLIWAVNKISDRSGNSIFFQYENDATTRKFRPDFIRYSDSSFAGSGHYEVDFVYQGSDRLDPVDRFISGGSSGGSNVLHTRLLARVDLKHDGTLYRKYIFSYATGLGTNSRLTSVQECVPGMTEDDCLAPTTFAWQTPTAGHAPAVASSGNATSPIPLDLNGDGYEDVAWASGGTWWYMLGGVGGYSSPSNTLSPATNPSKAMVLEFDGDGRDDLLVDWSDGKWRVLKGTETAGLATQVQAGPGAGIPSNTVYSAWRVADADGDGRDDLLRLRTTSSLVLYLRLNSPSGFGSETTALSDSMFRHQAFAPLADYGASSTRRADFNGDGRTDLLLYLCEWDFEYGTCFYTGWWTLLSNATTYSLSGNVLFALASEAPRMGHFNSDRLTDLAYRSPSTSKWCLGFGRGGGGVAVACGPSSVGYVTTAMLIADHDGDGYEDVYVRQSATSAWDVIRATGNDIATSPISTGLDAGAGTGWLVTDHNGDGLEDLGFYASSQWRTHAHLGTPADRLASAVDGFGNAVAFSYLLMTDSSIYEKGSNAVFPNQDYRAPMSLVRTMDVAPGGGVPYLMTYAYSAARVHAQGRAFLGMGTRIGTDGRNGTILTETFRQDFPFIGEVATSTLKHDHDDNDVYDTITDVTHTYALHTLEAAVANKRVLPYRSQTVTKAHEVGGIKNGNEITRITEGATVNTLGNTTAATVTVEDKDGGAPSFGEIFTISIASTYLEDQNNWCLAVPTSRSDTRTIPGGANQTRSIGWTVLGIPCRVTQETIQPGVDSDISLVSDLDYDDCGNLDSVSSYPVGLQSQARATAINFGLRCQRPESITNPEDHVSSFAYGWALALPTTLTDPNQLATTLEYDGFGRLKQRDNPDNTDALISLLACTSTNGWCGKDSTVRLKISQATRDSLNALIRTDEVFQDGFGRVRWAHSDSLESGPAIIQTAYDAFGRPIAQSQPHFLVDTVFSTVYSRDLIGRITQVNAPISEAQTSGRITGFAYEGRDLKLTDPKGNTTTRRGNAIGLLRSVIDPSPGGATTYAYQPFGELASITDAAGNITSWTYNLRGFVDGTNDPDSGSWEYTPNAFGEVTKIRDAKTAAPAFTTEFTFDDLSRPKSRTDVSESLVTTWNWGTSAASKNIGRLASITMNSGGYAEYFSYDSKARLSQQRIDADGSSHFFDLTYSSATGLLSTLEYPTSTSGYRLKLAYDHANGLLKRVKHATDATVYWEAISTDAWGHIQDENFGNGVQTFTAFDQASGLMQAREGGIGGGTGLIHAEVEWDLNGNLTRRKDLKLSPAITEDFFYDALDRFDESKRTVGAGTPETNANVTLDAIGNILWKQGVGTYTYHANKKRAVISAGSHSFGYDANGNMNVRNGASIGYTSFNLPSVINAPGGYSSTLSYGAFRNRFKLVAVGSQGTETTIYLAGLLEKVTNGSGTHYRHSIAGGKGTAAIHTRTVGGTNATVYVHRDHLGSPELITDSSGNELVRPSFAAYGERRDGDDWDGAPPAGDFNLLAGITRHGFTGHEHLDAVNLIHMNGRVYEPVVGRFLGKDPIVHVGLGQSPNSYSYVWNNPLTLIDPSGWDPPDCPPECPPPDPPDGGDEGDDDPPGGPLGDPIPWGDECRGQVIACRAPRPDDPVLQDRFPVGGSGVKYGVDANETNRRHWVTFMLGIGGSATISLLGNSLGREASIAIAITSGREGFDIGVIIVTGEPIDEFWLTANIGADAFVGGLGADFQDLEGTGQAVNVIVGPVAASGLIHADGADIPGGLIGANFFGPLPLGFSLTQTNTKIYSYRDAIDTVADWLCAVSATCIP